MSPPPSAISDDPALSLRELVKRIAQDPPEPFHHGCVRVFLKPLLTSLRLTGLYYEHHFYDEVDSQGVRPREANNVVGPTDIEDGRNSKPPHSLDGVQQVCFTDTALDSSKKDGSTVPRLRNGHSHGQSKDASTDGRFTANSVLVESECELKVDAETWADAVIKEAGAAEQSQGSSLTYRERRELIDACPDKNFLESFGFNVVSEASKQKREQKRKACVKAVLSDRTYAGLVLLMLWANLLRQPWSLQEGDIHGMVFLAPTSWFLLVTLNASVLFLSCTRRDHFCMFIELWVKLFKDPATRALGLRGISQSGFIKVALVIQWAVNITNTFCTILIMCMSDDFSGGINQAFYLNNKRSITSIVVSSVVTLFASFAWIGPPILLVSVSTLITNLFTEFNEVLKLHIYVADGKVPPALNELRLRYLAMCHLVQVMDRYVSLAVGCLYSVCISTSIFLLYDLIYLDMSISVRVILAFWLLGNMALIGVLTYFLSNVNIAMHAVSESLNTLHTARISNEELGYLQMFLSKVNGPTMGFTVMGLLTVTRELTLTLFSLYTTYAIILLQFK